MAKFTRIEDREDGKFVILILSLLVVIVLFINIAARACFSQCNNKISSPLFELILGPCSGNAV